MISVSLTSNHHLGAPTVDVIANTTQGAASVQITPANADSTKRVAEIVLMQVA